MKKALLRFFIEEGKSLYVKIKCFEEEGEEAPLIGISPDGEAAVSVYDFEPDYEKSDKLWFNQLSFRFSPDTHGETKLGVIHVKAKNAEDGIVEVSIKSLD